MAQNIILLILKVTRIIHISTRTVCIKGYFCIYFCTPSTLVTLYSSFIRPHLEYASAVWDPYLCKDIDLLDKTQTFALRVCLKNWSLSSDILHSQLNLPSLADRRRISKLCHLYKIVKNLEDFRSPLLVSNLDLTTPDIQTYLHFVLFMLTPLNSTFLFFLIPFLFGTPSVMILLIHPL